MTKEIFCVLTFCALALVGCKTVPKDNSQERGEVTSPRRIPRLKQPIESVAYYGSTHLWIVTGMGDLLRTQDCGITWEKTTAESVGGFERVSFIDGDQGWAINARGQVLSTHDGGRLWTAIASFSRPVVADEIKFEDRDIGWFSEPFSVWRTTDGGVSWARKEFETPLADASFANDQVAWVFDQEKRFFQTSNGGDTWQEWVTHLGDGDIRSMFYMNPNMGWLACCTNQLYRTDDGGRTWELKGIPGNNVIIDSLYFKDDNEGWAAGSERIATSLDDSGFKAILLHTLDGGQTWVVQHVDAVDVGFEAVYFADTLNGWLVGYDKVYRTDDGGTNWRIVTDVAHEIIAFHEH